MLGSFMDFLCIWSFILIKLKRLRMKKFRLGLDSWEGKHLPCNMHSIQRPGKRDMEKEDKKADKMNILGKWQQIKHFAALKSFISILPWMLWLKWCMFCLQAERFESNWIEYSRQIYIDDRQLCIFTELKKWLCQH